MPTQHLWSVQAFEDYMSARKCKLCPFYKGFLYFGRSLSTSVSTMRPGDARSHLGRSYTLLRAFPAGCRTSRISPVLNGHIPEPSVRVAESRKAFGSGALRVRTFTA